MSKDESRGLMQPSIGHLEIADHSIKQWGFSYHPLSESIVVRLEDKHTLNIKGKA